jgi:hypothetical protein
VNAAGIAGFLLGSLVGLLLRPALDSYLAWRHVKTATCTDLPSYPSLLEDEEIETWPM